jgi:hypothetical protein
MKGLIKCYTASGAIFMLLFGLFLIAGSVFLWINDEVFLGNSNIKYTFLGVALGLGIAVVGGAADGLYGICKLKASHMCVFQIFVILCMVLFIGLGVLLVFAPNLVFEGNCKESKNPAIG